jgi:hypothetical protein
VSNTDKPGIEERYRSAVHTSNMDVDARTSRSASDVVGAMGLADKHLTTGWVTTGTNGQGYSIPEAPLAAPLQRLLAGDSRAAHEIVRILAAMAWSKAETQRIKPKITRTMAHDMARACLAWHRNGACRPCGGHGFLVIRGSSRLGAQQCPACTGTGRLPFEEMVDPKNKRPERRELGRWLLAEMERSLGRAGPAAMAAIAPKLDL